MYLIDIQATVFIVRVGNVDITLPARRSKILDKKMICAKQATVQLLR